MSIAALFRVRDAGVLARLANDPPMLAGRARSLEAAMDIEYSQAHERVNIDLNEAQKVNPKRKRLRGTSPAQLLDATIMIVDDEPSTTEIVRMHLADEGYRNFVTSNDAAKARHLLTRTLPDVVLLDLVMPGVSGFELLTFLRKQRRLAAIPVLVLTSSSDEETKLQVLELGATDFLAKPVDRSELTLRIGNNLMVKLYQDRLRREREKSDHLLCTILPEPVANRLKRGERTIADFFDDATVLFADLVNFTDFASRMDPTRVVDRLNEVFQVFDTLVQERGLEKIKTIGDAYMLAGGLPVPSENHASAVVGAGLEMLERVAELNAVHDDTFSLRIGVHSGPVVAGVIGRSKFNYDLWGDTVNVASRMESQGVAGCVQISDATRQRLDGRFLIESRSPIEVKGKGWMQTHFVREHASVSLPSAER